MARYIGIGVGCVVFLLLLGTLPFLRHGAGAATQTDTAAHANSSIDIADGKAVWFLSKNRDT